MRYGPAVLDEIKARLPVSVVVGRRVALKKAGREWRGLSPFSAEKTPSFFVNDTKQAWFDFSSGRNGDVFTFLMETEGVSFTEAVERLASEAGVVLPRSDAMSEAHEKRRLDLYDAMTLAQEYFRAALKKDPAREARAYLATRGLVGAVAEKFGLGYAPADRHGLKDHLAAKGVSAELMAEAGLVIAGADIPVAYDRFRDRVMFPIEDAKGRIIAFGGRALAKEAQAKYLNSPETPIFHKGATLYNLHRARKAAHKAESLYVVEGYVDAIALDRAQIPQVVAPLGTALTEEQLALVWRMAPVPVLCFDGDKAGLRAAYRAIDIALPHLEAGRSLSFAFLPDGQDPDDLLRAAGPEALQAALKDPRPLVDVLFARERDKTPLDTPEERAGLEKRLFTAVATIREDDLKRHYRQAMRDKLGALFQSPRQTMGGRNNAPAGQRYETRAPARGAYGGDPAGYNTFRQQAGGRAYGGRNGFPNAPLIVSEGLRRNPLLQGSAIPRREAALVMAAVHHPIILEHEAEPFAELVFSAQATRQVRTGLLDYLARGSGALTPGTSALEALQARGLGEALARCETAAMGEPMAHPAVTDPQTGLLGEELPFLLAWREAAALQARQSFLHSEIAAISDEFVAQGGEDRFERLKALVLRREALPGAE